MLGFGVTDKSCIAFAVILLPVGQLLVATTIAHATQKLIGRALGSSVAQGIQTYRNWYLGEGINFERLRQHRRLTVQPHQINEKSEQDQKSGSNGNRDLDLG